MQIGLLEVTAVAKHRLFTGKTPLAGCLCNRYTPAKHAEQPPLFRAANASPVRQRGRYRQQTAHSPVRHTFFPTRHTIMDIRTFNGLHTALITPFENGKVAFEPLRKLVRWQLDEGIDGLVAVGTTGESPTLDHKEHSAVIAAIAEEVGGKVPVLAGTGSNATDEAVALTADADGQDGVTGMLVVAPYYNKPSQEGLFRHFSAIAEATAKPVVLYSIPGRCGIEIGVETCARLREKYPHVLGIKEAGGNVERVARLRRLLGEDYLILSGDDSQTLPFMSYGATGVISVASNLVVRELSQIVKLALANDFQAASKIALRLYPLFTDIFLEPNPVPIKFLMKHCGMINSDEVRLPLSPLTDATRERLLQMLESTGLAHLAAR